MVNTSTGPDVPVMSLSEIAEFAGVRRPVPTTWRRRHPDFPPPVSSYGGSPQFDGRAVCSWLVDTGRAERENIEPELWLYALTALGQRYGTKPLLAATTALLCLHHLDGEPLAAASQNALAARAAAADPVDLLLRSEVTNHAGVVRELATVIDALIEAAWGVAPAFERLMDLRGRLGASELHGLHPQLTMMMAELSGVARHAERSGAVHIADPNAGPGDLLLATASLIGEAHAPVLTAAEPDDFLARLLRRRLLVHGLPAEDVTVSAQLDDHVTADVIVTALPYRPGEARSALESLTALDDLAVRLAPGCTAVVLGPAHAFTAGLPRYSAAERLRSELLTGGSVEAVVRLPGGMLPSRPGYETALWVLTAPHDGRLSGRVLLGDIADRELSADVASACVADVVTWRRDGHRPDSHTRAFCISTQVGELVGRSQPLTPRALPSLRERAMVLPETVAKIAELEVDLARFAEPTRPREQVASGLKLSEETAQPAETIATLIGKQVLKLGKGSRIHPGDVGPRGHHRVLGIPELSGTAELSGASRRGSRMIDRAVLAAGYPRAQLTEPGDLVVALNPEPGVYLDERGFSVVEFPVRSLRVNAKGRDRYPPRVLAALLETAARARAAGAIRAPRKLLDWELPVLDSDTAHRMDTLLSTLDSRRKQAQAELDALDELRRIAVTGITNATLTFT